MKLLKNLPTLATALLAFASLFAGEAFASQSMLMPSIGVQYCAQSGTCYTANANSMITGVATGDVVDMIRAGGYTLDQVQGINNYNSTTTPTTTNDSTQGYGVGSEWLNKTTGVEYVCSDATANAAVWNLVMTYSGATNVNAGFPLQLQAFSVTPAKNPLMIQTVQNVPVASVNQAGGYAFLSGIPGRTIYPGMLTVEAFGGTAASATRVMVTCTGGNVLLSAPIAALVSAVPISPFYSSGAAGAAPGTGMMGCAVSDGVFISNVGSSLTGSTGLIVNFIGTIQ